VREQAREQKPSQIATVLTIVFAIAFLAELYLFAATASIYDSYQPGISAFRIRLHPLVLLLFSGGAPLIAALVWRTRRAPLARFSERIGLLGGVISLVALLVLLGLETAGVRCDDPLPLVRELRTTLEHSLRCPTFSGRSAAAPVYGALLSALVLVGSRIVRRGG